MSPGAYVDDGVRRGNKWDAVPLHDAVGVNCEKCGTTDVKTLVASIWAKR